MGLLRRLSLCLPVLLLSFTAYAQTQEKEEPEDSIVVLISSKKAQLLEINGQSLRKVTGPATFLHNNTYLLCDTALWNVDTKIIDAIGNVKIIQEETELQSEKMVYYIDRDLAEFRGNVVQLRDKDNNILRTRNLDYNTKDSIAVFRGGGSMKDKDGQIIESQTGKYESKIKLFTFTEDVNMFTDSIFVKTSRLKYESDRNLATFGYGTDAWKDENMLSANAGWYDRGREVFFFNNNVHVMSDVQEGWSDSLYFYRNTMNVDMLGDAQVTDTSRNVSGLAGHISYVDSLARVTMTRTPAVVAEIEDQESGRDTVFFGADTLIYYTVRMCDVDSMAVVDAAARLSSMDVDPVSEFRKKAAAEAAKAAEEAAKNDPNRRPDTPPGKTGTKQKPDKAKEADMANADSLSAAADSLSVGPDSLSVGLDSLSAGLDSLSAGADSLALADSAVTPPVEPDTTKIGFVKALNNVKIYRRNMQIVCDSLEYCDLDSIARLFKQPVIWNEVTQQYVADSVYALVRGSRMEKVSLMSNAFIHMQEDSVHYDQIKGAEMMAYFSPSNELERFDALGGASALFYLEENDVLATVNRKECKMLSAYFTDGNIHRIYYFDTAVSDAYPVAQMSSEDQKLKGFNWIPDSRPADRYAVTPLALRHPERDRYSAEPRAAFVRTGIYFPGYMDDIYVQIAVRDSLEKVRERERAIEEREQKRLAEIRMRDSLFTADSLKAVTDSIAKADSLKAIADSLHVADSLASLDSARLAAKADSTQVLTKQQLREQAKAARQAKREQRQARKEARWEEMDRRDAAREQAKKDRKLAKERKRKLKFLQAEAEEARKEALELEKYKEKFAARQARKEARKARKGQKAETPADTGPVLQRDNDVNVLEE